MMVSNILEIELETEVQTDEPESARMALLDQSGSVVTKWADVVVYHHNQHIHVLNELVVFQGGPDCRVIGYTVVCEHGPAVKQWAGGPIWFGPRDTIQLYLSGGCDGLS